MSFDVFYIFGIIGMGVIILAIAYSMLLYRGRDGERFSLLNHYISELGEVGISKGAWAFNAGLIFGGLASLFFVIGLSIEFGSVLGWLGGTTGVVATLGVSAVGVFPMNNLDAHNKAAMTYFRAGLVMVFFFGLAILFQSAERVIVPPFSNLLSLLAFLAYGAFLSLPKNKDSGQDSTNPPDQEWGHDRPRVWLAPTLEWAVFFSTVAWFLGMAILAEI